MAFRVESRHATIFGGSGYHPDPVAGGHRDGTVVKLMERGTWDERLLAEFGCAMSDASICDLGQAAANPLNSVLRHFGEDAGS